MVKHIVNAGTVLLMVVLTISFCHALTMEDTGFTWKSADVNEREDFCKPIAEKLGRDCHEWINDINSVFDTNNPIILNMKLIAVLNLAHLWYTATEGKCRLANQIK